MNLVRSKRPEVVWVTVGSLKIGGTVESGRHVTNRDTADDIALCVVHAALSFAVEPGSGAGEVAVGAVIFFFLFCQELGHICQFQAERYNLCKRRYIFLDIRSLSLIDIKGPA